MFFFKHHQENVEYALGRAVLSGLMLNQQEITLENIIFMYKKNYFSSVQDTLYHFDFNKQELIEICKGKECPENDRTWHVNFNHNEFAVTIIISKDIKFFSAVLV